MTGAILFALLLSLLNNREEEILEKRTTIKNLLHFRNKLCVNAKCRCRAGNFVKRCKVCYARRMSRESETSHVLFDF